MVEIIKQRMTAKVEEDFVVFLIGMRINRLWKLHQWMPIATAMSKMIAELYKNPDMGFISHEQWFGRTTITVQYWRSFEQLDNYAKSKSCKHLPAWANFNKMVGSGGDVGIWHETYLSGRGSYESVYNNMPKFGLAKAMSCVPATGAYQSASQRINTR